MKKIKLFNIIGMVAVLIAFVGMAVGAVFTWNWAFFTGLAFLVSGIVFTVILPGIIVSKWVKLMNDHGVPATAVLLRCIPVPRTNDVKLEFQVTESEITTSAYAAGGKNKEYCFDSLWNIKYDPDNTELCLIVNEIKKEEITKESFAEEKIIKTQEMAAEVRPDKNAEAEKEQELMPELININNIEAGSNTDNENI